MSVACVRPPWGWTVKARGLLAILAVVGALGLTTAREPATSPQPLGRLIVDPNTAPPPVLAALPKLGPALVDRIVTARTEAPFQSLEDFDARVRGIGPATLAALRPHLRIAPRESDPVAPVPVPTPRTAHHTR